MIGFLFGTACLVAIFAMARSRRSGWAHACGGSGMPERWGFDGHRRRWEGPSGGRGFGFFRPLDALFDRLDATPEQERAVRDAIGDLRRKGREARGAADEARRALATVLRQESFDELALGEAQAKSDEAFEQAKRAVIDATAKLHGVLDGRQRRILADVVEDGPRALFRRRARQEV